MAVKYASYSTDFTFFWKADGFKATTFYVSPTNIPFKSCLLVASGWLILDRVLDEGGSARAVNFWWIVFREIICELVVAVDLDHVDDFLLLQLLSVVVPHGPEFGSPLLDGAVGDVVRSLVVLVDVAGGSWISHPLEQLTVGDDVLGKFE